MKTLRSYVCGAWHEASGNFVLLVDPCSEEIIAQASTSGIDFGAALDFARARGGPALRELSFTERGELLMKMSKALHEHRDELIDLSLLNTGATRKDAKFDLDGATGTLAYYSYQAKELGKAPLIVDGDAVQLGRTARFCGQHVRLPLTGVALHINAFNFPAWGFAEKAACALLAGMPVITKPATSTSLVTERCIEIVIEAGILPEGVLSFLCGSTGDLVKRLGGQDVLAFTGSASTALSLRSSENLLSSSARVNIEADSLNAAVLGPDVDMGDETWSLFLRDVGREMLQKSGQKCTAVRRILVPEQRLDDVQGELSEQLSRTVVGNPAAPSVTMGPLATAQQLEDAVDGVARLRDAAEVVHGSGERADGVGADPGKGFFFGPVLLRTDPERGGGPSVLHEHEVFGPVATLVPYDGSPAEAARIVALAGGSLVSSVYSNDRDYLRGFLAGTGPWSGRVYIGSRKVADQVPGSGVALPQMLHGGPGRAGGGEELGALRGPNLYLQRLAVTGDRGLLDCLTGART